MVPSGPRVSAVTRSGVPSMDSGGGAGGARRHRVVAAGRPRVAAREASYGEPAAAHAAVVTDRVECVGRAAGVIATDLAVERTDHGAIGPEQTDQHVLHDAAPVRAAAGESMRRALSRQRLRSAPSSALSI